MLLVTVGTGIGGGLVLDGRLRLGLHGAAGEVGHQTIVPDGLPCNCGSKAAWRPLPAVRVWRKGRHWSRRIWHPAFANWPTVVM